MRRRPVRHAADALTGLALPAAFALPVFIMSVFTMPAAAQGGSADASGRATATVVRPLSATPENELSFGALVVSPTAGGEVSVPADGSAAQYTGSVSPSCNGNGACAPHPARFAVTGEAQRSYRIELPLQVLAHGSRTGVTLAVDALTARSNTDPGQAGAGMLDAEGQDSFTVGGRLAVPAGTQPDIFRADLPITVHYN